MDRLARKAIPRAAHAAGAEATRVYLRIAGPSGSRRGAGGWAAGIVRSGDVDYLRGGFTSITANHLALKAACAALAHVAPGERAYVFSNNSYLHDSITKWVEGWRKTGWIRKTDGKPVRFREEWQALDRLNQERDIVWVRLRVGEAGGEDREVFDLLKPLADAARASAAGRQ
ncbi:MAG: hypothetical protein M5R40_13675 [Anaerolineae bacterium]|nr:hypothetical protein [Anaerolineae bacterium]